MTKQEFLDTLGRALNRELSEQEVLDNLRYYDTYIEQEKAKGKTEDQVLMGLGDPRLIARTILQVDEQREEETYGTADRTVYSDGSDAGYADAGYEEDVYGEKDIYRSSPFGRNVRVHTVGGFKFWLILIAVLVVIFAVLGTAFAILWKLLPFLIVAGAVMWVYRKFFG